MSTFLKPQLVDKWNKKMMNCLSNPQNLSFTDMKSSQQRSAENTNTLLALWCSTDVQTQLQSATRTKKKRTVEKVHFIFFILVASQLMYATSQLSRVCNVCCSKGIVFTSSRSQAVITGVCLNLRLRVIPCQCSYYIPVLKIL